MKNGKMWAIKALAAGAVLAAPAQAFAWHELLPGNICQANIPVSGLGGFGQWEYVEGTLVASNFSSGQQVVAVCPFVQGGATVNAGGGSWWFQDSQVVTLSVSVDVTSGDEVTAFACLANATGGTCGNGASTLVVGPGTLHPDLSKWATDNGSIPAYIKVDLGFSSSVNSIFAANY